MLKVLLCCMGGFSSSAMIQKLKKDIVEQGYSDKLQVEFHGFGTAYEIMNDYDIIFTCPHLKYEVPNFVKKYHPSMPIYILPPKLYARMTPECVLEDAEDVLAGYKETGKNPFCFPGEENNLRIKRDVSHRRSI